MFWKPKSCSICANPLTYEYGIFDTLQGRKFNNPDKTLYCRSHFFQKVRESIAAFDRPFIFHKYFEDYKSNQLFYYTINTLPLNEYSKQDCADVSELLSRAKDASANQVILIENEVIKDAYQQPLFKIKDPKYNLITKDKFVPMLSDIILQLETTNQKGCFWFCIPYSDSGIYLWFEV